MQRLRNKAYFLIGNIKDVWRKNVSHHTWNRREHWSLGSMDDSVHKECCKWLLWSTIFYFVSSYFFRVGDTDHWFHVLFWHLCNVFHLCFSQPWSTKCIWVKVGNFLFELWGGRTLSNCIADQSKQGKFTCCVSSFTNPSIKAVMCALSKACCSWALTTWLYPQEVPAGKHDTR